MHLQPLKRFSSFLILTLCLVMAVSMLTLTGFAQGSEMNFTVRPLLSGELQDTSLGYFNITTDENKVYDLQIEVVNKSSKEAVYEIEITNATTTNIGEVNYEVSDVIDETLKHPLTSIAKIKDTTQDGTFKVPGNQQKTFTVEVKAPAEAYEGVILGGIRVKDITERLEREQVKESSETTEGAGIKIHQEYQAIVAIQLRDSDAVVKPNFELVDVFPETYNYRAAVVAQIRNTQPLLVKKAVYTASVSAKGSSDFIFKVENADVDFAPNSVMDYTFIDNIGTGIKPGTYLFEGKIVFDGETWEFSKEFVIEAKQAEQINSEALNQQQQGFNTNGMPLWLIIVVLAILVILILLLVFVLLSLKKKNKENEQNI